jgi:hypothetical protein
VPVLQVPVLPQVLLVGAHDELPQQTPITQLPLEHSVPAPQDIPLPLTGTHVPDELQ